MKIPGLVTICIRCNKIQKMIPPRGTVKMDKARTVCPACLKTVNI